MIVKSRNVTTKTQVMNSTSSGSCQPITLYILGMLGILQQPPIQRE